MTMEEVFISKKSCKIYENAVKSPAFMQTFKFPKVFTRPIWSLGLMFDTPELHYTSLNPAEKLLRLNQLADQQTFLFTSTAEVISEFTSRTVLLTDKNKTNEELLLLFS